MAWGLDVKSMSMTKIYTQGSLQHEFDGLCIFRIERSRASGGDSQVHAADRQRAGIDDDTEGHGTQESRLLNRGEKYWPLIRQNVIKKIAPIKDLIKEIKDRVKAIDTRKQSRKKNEKPGSARTVPNLAVSYLSDAR